MSPGSYGSIGAGYGDASTFPSTEGSHAVSHTLTLVHTIFFSARLGVRTVSFNLAVGAFDDFAQMWPFCKVFEVEADVVGLSQVVQIARIELEQVHRSHGSNGRHCVTARRAVYASSLGLWKCGGL